MFFDFSKFILVCCWWELRHSTKENPLLKTFDFFSFFLNKITPTRRAKTDKHGWSIPSILPRYISNFQYFFFTLRYSKFSFLQGLFKLLSTFCPLCSGDGWIILNSCKGQKVSQTTPFIFFLSLCHRIFFLKKNSLYKYKWTNPFVSEINFLNSM